MAREIAGKDPREGEGEREDPGVWSWELLRQQARHGVLSFRLVLFCCCFWSEKEKSSEMDILGKSEAHKPLCCG